jgi:hypothetical protein
MSDYELISETIAKEMEKAWISIMTKLASAPSPSSFSTTTGATVSVQSLAGFFSELGAANIAISFAPTNPGQKKEASNNTTIQIAPELQQHMISSASTLGFNGTITIGATFGF